MSQFLTFELDPMRVPPIALSFAKQRELAEQYAADYDSDSGDTLREYVDRCAYDVYPGGAKAKMERVEFKTALRAELRRLGRR